MSPKHKGGSILGSQSPIVSAPTETTIIEEEGELEETKHVSHKASTVSVNSDLKVLKNEVEVRLPGLTVASERREQSPQTENRRAGAENIQVAAVTSKVAFSCQA